MIPLLTHWSYILLSLTHRHAFHVSSMLFTSWHLLSKVNIWYINCARATNSIHFWHKNECSCKSVKVFETENISTWGGLKPTIFGFMPNVLTYWAIRARHLLSHVFEHWFWLYRYFWSTQCIMRPNNFYKGMWKAKSNSSNLNCIHMSCHERNWCFFST